MIKLNIRRKVFCTLVFSFLLLGISVYLVEAASDNPYEASLTTLKAKIKKNESAIFDLAITNNRADDDKFNIRMSEGFWSVTSQPLYAYQTEFGFDVGASATEHTTLYLTPPGNIGIGTYSIPVTITSERYALDQNLSAIISVVPDVEPVIVREYQPTIQVDVQVSESGLIDPRKDAVIFITLDNQNPLNISTINVRVRSQLINKDIITELAPLEQKTEQFAVRFNPTQPPVKDVLIITITRNDEVLKVVKKNFEIIAYSNLVRDDSESSSFLGLLKQNTISLINNGNIARTETLSIPLPKLAKAFSSAEPAGFDLVKTDQGYEYRWSVELAPDASKEMSVSINYFPILVVFILVLLVVIAYYLFRSPLLIVKEASVSHRGQADVSQMKVLLFVKNRSGKQLSNVRVLDKIPHIAELKDEVIIGTLRPIRVSQSKSKATIVEWVIPVVEPYEERIISYKIRSSLSIVGLFNLPPAMIKFRHRGDKDTVVLSNGIKATEKKDKQQQPTE